MSTKPHTNAHLFPLLRTPGLRLCRGPDRFQRSAPAPAHPCQFNSRSLRSACALFLSCIAGVPSLSAQVAVPPTPLIAPGSPLQPPAKPTLAPENAEIPEPLLAQLDSPELGAREDATRKIGDPLRFGMNSIQRSLARPGLSPEQRQRLLSAGYELFKSTPRGAMGVAFDGTTAAGVLVRPAQQGFDASRVLRADDAIRAVDGRRIEDQDQIRVAIISRDPGEPLPLTLVRNGVPIETVVRLGSYTELRNSQSLDDSVLAAAWSYRVARLGGSSPQPPVVSGVASDRWEASALRQRQALTPSDQVTHDPFTGEQVRSRLPRPIIAALAMGGQIRDQARRATRELASLGAGVRVQGGNGVVIVPNDRPRGRVGRAPVDQARRDALLNRQQTLLAQIQSVQRLINNAQTAPDDRARLSTELVQLSTEFASVQQDLAELFRQP